MVHEQSWLQKVRFYTTISALYLITVLFVGFAVHAGPLLDHARPVALTQKSQQPYSPTKAHVTVISGRPVRIVIPSELVDLPVDPGYYDSVSNSWTLSGYRAQFAMLSTLANNQTGETFIYGHNNNYVFGPLRHNMPQVGSLALLYTDNGHIFAYTFQSARSLGPNDVSVLNYSGAPQMTIQTCTGSLNEWRTMYQFSFSKVVQ